MWTKGEQVYLTYNGDVTVEAEIVMVSPNGESLMVVFDGSVDGHLGGMPLLMTPAGWRSVFMDATVVLTPRGARH